MEDVNDEFEIDEQGHAEDYDDPQMILGNRERVRLAGTIRGGVKVPKNACSDKEKELYKKLDAQGMAFDNIDKEMGGTPKTASSKLTPRNADHFVIRDDDFTRPADAQIIRNNYADADGKVRRIPVWFPVGDLERAIPHAFLSFDGSGSLRASSSYKNGELTCSYLGKDPKKPTQEIWMDKPCDPEKCPAKNSKKCSFTGAFFVNIPGVRGIGGIKVPTKSWYGLGDAIAVLKGVKKALGRFDSLFKGEPFLELVKVPQKVKCPDGTRKNQFIITLELSVDPMEIERYNEPAEVAMRGAAALQALAGRPAVEAPVAPVAAVVPSPVVAVGESTAESASEPIVSKEVKAPVADAAGVVEENAAQPAGDSLPFAGEEAAEPLLPPIPQKEVAPEPPAPPASSSASVKVVEEGMIKTVQTRQKRANMPDEVLAEKLKESNVSKLEEFPAASVNDLLTWIGKWKADDAGKGVPGYEAAGKKEAANAGVKSVSAGAGVNAGPEVF